MQILDANGANIPALGLGTWQLRGTQCRDMVEAALDHGYSHVDTAIMYENEEMVGQGLARSSRGRDDVFLTTKVWPDDAGDGDLQRALEGSLERLGTDRVDLLLVHWPSRSVPFAQTARALDDVVRRGMAVNVGISNFTTPQIEEAVRECPRPLACNQVEHHPYLDQRRVREACDRHGLALVGYCPLFRGGSLFEEPIITDAAEAHGRTPAQVVLRWHVQGGCVAIPKTATPSRMRENIDIFDFQLTDDEMSAISALGARHERLCDYAFSPDWDEPLAA